MAKTNTANKAPGHNASKKKASPKAVKHATAALAVVITGPSGGMYTVKWTATISKDVGDDIKSVRVVQLTSTIPLEEDTAQSTGTQEVWTKTIFTPSRPTGTWCALATIEYVAAACLTI